MKKSTKEAGKFGEDIAASFLKESGYKIIERNYRCPFGEIDIIAKEDGDVVFVEVKCRRSEKFGDPASAVGLKKQKKISIVALNYLKDKRLVDKNARFDVVSVRLMQENKRVELIKNAFDFSL